jgi:prepilin-type N-terminal cleavage/methylation domain-containing protein
MKLIAHTKRTLKSDSRGFTFLEIVISISILAVIMGVTYSSLNQIIRSKKILDDARDGKAIADSILSRMTREFQQAVNSDSATLAILPPRNNLTKPYLGKTVFLSERKEQSQGQIATTITFLTLAQPASHIDPENKSEYIQVTYRVEPDPDDPNKERLRLIREEVPFITPASKAYKRTLAFPISQDILQFEFLFYDSNKEAWIESWGKHPNLNAPPLIQVLFRIRSPLGAVQTYSTIIALPRKG